MAYYRAQRILDRGAIETISTESTFDAARNVLGVDRIETDELGRRAFYLPDPDAKTHQPLPYNKPGWRLAGWL